MFLSNHLQNLIANAYAEQRRRCRSPVDGCPLERGCSESCGLPDPSRRMLVLKAE